eukprot:gene11370-23795_t
MHYSRNDKSGINVRDQQFITSNFGIKISLHRISDFSVTNINAKASVINGDFNAVAEALRGNVDPNSLVSDEFKASHEFPQLITSLPVFHLALGHCNKDIKSCTNIAIALLDAGADPNACSSTYPPAVIYAMSTTLITQNQLSSVLSSILTYSALRDKFSFELSTQHWNQIMNFPHSPPFLSYILARRFPLILPIIMKYCQDISVHVTDKQGVTPLHMAVWFDMRDETSVLLRHGADVTARDVMNRTVLHYAAIRRHSVILRHLLQHTLSSSNLSVETISAILRQSDVLGYSARDIAAHLPQDIVMLEDIHDALARYQHPPLTSSSSSSDSSYEAPRTDSPNDNTNDNDSNNDNDPHAAQTSTSTPALPSKLQWKCSSRPSYLDSNRTDVDVRHWSELSIASFDREYRGLQRPVVITGNITGSTLSMWKYIDKTDFVERYKDLRLSTGVIPYVTLYTSRTEFRREVPLAEWIIFMDSWTPPVDNEGHCDSATGSGSGLGDSSSSSSSCSLPQRGRDGAWIAFDNSVRAQSDVFASDVELPELFRYWEREGGGGGMRRYGMQLSIGGFSSGSPAHGHDAAFNILLTGRKRWFLLAPDAMGPRDRFWAEDKHPLAQLDVFEKLRESGQLFEVTQYPGDVVYVPADWVHATLNTCDTVALAQEFGIGMEWNPPHAIANDLYGHP